MIAVTSISPSHANFENQKEAVKSWLGLGFKVFSFNSELEVPQLQSMYDGVEFISTHRTGQNLFKKPYAMISSMIDWAKDKSFENILLINSDIILEDSNGRLKHLLTQSGRGLIVFNRFDYKEDKERAKRYEYGMDAFILDKRFYGIYPQSIYCMGQTWWDYWIQYRAIVAGVPVYREDSRVLLHKEHANQYSGQEWEHMTRYFQWENKFKLEMNRPQLITNFVFQMLQQEYRKHAHNKW